MMSYVVFPRYSSGGIPEHGCCGHAVFGDETFGIVEIAVGTHADYLDVFGVVLSELLNGLRFALTSRSMGVPEPQQHRSITDDGLGQSSG